MTRIFRWFLAWLFACDGLCDGRGAFCRGDA